MVVALNAYTRKLKRSYINNSMLHLKALEKQEQEISKKSRQKEVNNSVMKLMKYKQQEQQQKTRYKVKI